MLHILALDIGGTKSDALLVREDGIVLGWGRYGFAQIRGAGGWGGSGRSVEAITHAIELAMGDIECDELHVSDYGFLRPEYMPGFSGRLILHPRHEHDGLFELAKEQYGVVASAGTGAFAYGLTPEGESLHLDSLGPVLGDYGSGYYIGVLAVQAVARSDWHSRHSTSLVNKVRKALSISNYVPYGHSLVGCLNTNSDRATIAALSRIVDVEARAGDGVARQILETAAAALAETVFDVYDRLSISGPECAMVGTGSVIEKSDIFWESLRGRVMEFAPDLRCVRTDLPHVVGTALMLLRELCGDNFAAVQDNLFNSACKVMR